LRDALGKAEALLQGIGKLDGKRQSVVAQLNAISSFKSLHQRELISSLMAAESSLSMLQRKLADHRRPPYAHADPTLNLERLRSRAAAVRAKLKDERLLHAELQRLNGLDRVNDKHAILCEQVVSWCRDKLKWLEAPKTCSSAAEAQLLLQSFDALAEVCLCVFVSVYMCLCVSVCVCV
jgi:hypothetical protein